jgi:hypothetical protein
MKRFSLFVFLAACGTSADDVITDASIDQSQDVTGDVTTKDATVDAQDAAPDAQDATSTDASDATSSDVSQLDVIVDAITIDVKNGCADNNACNSNELCDKGTANCNGVGKCTPIPQFCPQIVNPVCGCDKKTYNNSCYANKGLTSVAYSGVCE